MRNLRLYSADTAFKAYEQNAGGDGLYTETIIPGVSMSKDERKRYFNPHDKTKLRHTITIFYKDLYGQTLSEPTTKSVKYFQGVSQEIVLTPKNIDNANPLDASKNATIPTDSAITFTYKSSLIPPPTGYVETNLVAMYDGIYNTPTGHDSNAIVWSDLSNNGYDLTPTSNLVPGKFYWEEDGFKSEKDGVTCPVAWVSNKIFPTTGSNNTLWTVELVARVTDDSGFTNGIFSTFTETGGSYYGEINYGHFLSSNHVNTDRRFFADGSKYYQSYNYTSGIYTSSSTVYFSRYMQFPYVTSTGNVKSFIYSSIDGFKTCPNITLNNYSQYTTGSFNPTSSKVMLCSNKVEYYSYIIRGLAESGNMSKIKVYACRLYNRQLSQAELQQNALIDATRFGF